MSSITNVTNLLAAIASQGRDFLTLKGDEARKALLRSLRRLYLALETPIEATLRMTWAEGGLMGCIGTALQMKLFHKMSLTDPKSSAELAADTASDPVLVSRLLKHMAAMDVIVEASSDHYLLTKFTEALTIPQYGDAFPLYLKTTGVSMGSLPEFLASIDFKNPDDPTNSPFQYGLKSPDPFFKWLESHPEVRPIFNNHMAGYVMGRKNWIDTGCYPVQDRLLNGADPDGVILVDIGGGTGRDINAFHEKFGSKCVLQDLPDVVAAATPVVGVKVVSHDMFTPQPIEGARAYFLHSVLHDWSDMKCVDILNNIKPAMKKDYSKILINENVIPSSNAYWMSTGMDIVMMNIFATAERTEETWHKIFDAAGMTINQIYTYDTGSASIIEAELA